ncbi:MAG TPA: 4-alpha-glucanotransferase [Cellvibrio sp.]|nr:4-alpha-glucanotransferase [Cellvibrio sp.]
MSEKHISTSALARLLHKESKELFSLLAQGGWMVKVDNHWQLTEKGKFEGGIYINHPKYGEYIAWPETVQDHPLLKLLPEAPLGATHIGGKLELPARLVNLLLAERGWIKKHIRGWLLTPRGKAIGGEQHTSDQGIPFVTWPETLLENPRFLTAVAQLNGAAFALSPQALSGQTMHSPQAFIVENWLYFAGVQHACQYELQFAEERAKADFFIKDAELAIDIWSVEDTAATLSEKLERQAFYKKHNYEFIEIHQEALQQLDELLAKSLLGVGLAIY